MAHSPVYRGSHGPSTFLVVVLSAIGTAAGGLILLASFFFGAEGRADMADAGGFFQNMRWLALALTALCGSVLVIGLSKFAGRDWPRAMKLAAAIFLLGAVIIGIMMFRTLPG